MTKIVYQLDVNGLYMGPTVADESPLEPGVFLIPAGCVETAPPDMAAGDTARWVDGAWQVVQPTPPAPVPPDLKLYAASRRYAVETGGISFAGVAIDTGRDSQAMITGAYACAQANPTATIWFKAASGWVDLDATAVAAIAGAVGAHVQACFAAEQAVDAAIDAGTVTTTAQVDAWSWPA